MESPTIWIEVEGGLVQRVFSNHITEVNIIDLDNNDDDEKLKSDLELLGALQNQFRNADIKQVY